MSQDSRGLNYSGCDQQGVALFEEAFAWILDYQPNAMPKIDAILERYPDFVMAWVFKGYSIASEGRHSAFSGILPILGELKRLSRVANERELLHITALSHYQKGQVKEAVDVWSDILNQWPLDLVAFRQSTGNLFWFGEGQRLVDTAAKISPAWTEQTSGYGYFAGAFGFALEEVGQYDLAEKYARKAVDLNPSDLWAIHAMAHVFEMNARTDEGIEWITSRAEQLHQHNAFVGHVWWHLALFELELGRVENVLSLFDENIYPEASNFYLSVQNGASLLKRLEFIGVDVGDRWERLYEGVKEDIGDYVYLFTELHSAMILARNEKHDAIKKLNDSLKSERPLRYSYEGNLAIQLIAGIESYEKGEFKPAVTSIKPIRYRLSALGGSHAQQDIIGQYLIHSEHLLKHHSAVAGLMKERVSKRTRWDLSTARFLDKNQEIDRMLTSDNKEEAFKALLRKVI
ncbi:tetratricopeptide repeat protein [Enterovibrio calviensis]|uniref:tetratricopeptide repeat protein n=1 Tax=Enterovibrio calviensis TaxID=91359 RepID=UPI00373615E5